MMTNNSDDSKPRNLVPPKVRPVAKQNNSLMTGFLNQVASSTTRVVAMTLVGAVTSAIFNQDSDDSDSAQDDLADESE